jgi:trimeric autotransporter adhesin
VTVTTDPTPGATAGVTAVPTQYVVPRVHGDPAAARALASTYRVLAEDVDASARTAARMMAELSAAWRGRGQHASAHPGEVLQRNAAVTSRALHDAADALDAYAHKLEAAHHHHFFSLHKLMAVAAVVTVTAVAVVVTMGAAAAAEAAIAASAAGEATAAAGAAAAASSGAAAGLLESTAGLAGVRALLSFVVPHLVQAELSAGFAATVEESVDGRLDWHEIGTAAGAGFAGSAGAASAARVAQSVKFAKETWPLLHALLPHLGQAAAWGGVDAGQQVADGGHLSLRELLLSTGLAGAGSAMSTRIPLVAHAYSGRQTAGQMLAAGVDLTAHEGDTLGHTLAKHVNVTDADLRARIIGENRKWASRFYDADAATRAIDFVLERNRDKLLAFAGSGGELRLRAVCPSPIGVVMDRSLSLHEATQVVVRLVRDNDGIFIMTAYPELPRR